ncbi:MAG TPA: hypothetical protein VNJ01_11645 [Bacteriovoracaceae bacterium]|nr:hypothetical protein [Bacteriovoracaceae bacterium]
MKVYPEELELFAKYTREELQDFPLVTDDQFEQMRTHSRKLKEWEKQHWVFHNTLNVVVLTLLVSLMVYFGMILPTQLAPSYSMLFLCAGLYGFVSYSLCIFTLHEGAGHNSIIRNHGPISRALGFVANNLCRLSFADSSYYHSIHPQHHHSTATENDCAFTNYVMPKRFLISMLPLSGVMPYCDYKIHTPPTMTKSKLVTDLIGTTWILIIAYQLLTHGYSVLMTAVFIVFMTWVSFTVDRIRETTEHNLMPGNKNNVARSFGPNLWGLFICGGPWGQVCHLMHHMLPSATWYQQIILHYRFKAIATPAQLEAFCMQGGMLDYPKVAYKILRTNIKDYFYAKGPGPS